MGEHPDPVDDGEAARVRMSDARGHSSARDGPSLRLRELRVVVVRNDGGRDRATMYPPELSGVERMETWLSANANGFVDLVACR